MTAIRNSTIQKTKFQYVTNFTTDYCASNDRFWFIQESTRCSKELAVFFKKRLETLPITARSFEKDYHINGDNFERSYKEGGRLNGFKRTGPISGFKT